MDLRQYNLMRRYFGGAGFMHALENFANGCGNARNPFERCCFPEDWEAWDEHYFGGAGEKEHPYMEAGDL